MATHKWMLYVRGGKHNPDISAVVSRVEVGSSGFRTVSGCIFLFQVELHPSYSPHHLVEISTPPFHLTRRGWGEIFQPLHATFCYFCLQHLFYLFLAYSIVLFFLLLSLLATFLLFFLHTTLFFFFLLFLLAKYSIRLTPGERCKKLFFTGFDNIYAFCTYAKKTHKKEHFFVQASFP